MVTAGLTREAVLDPGSDVTFPESVVQLFRGELGQPTGGFPHGLQSKVLAGRPALTARPGALMPAVDLAAERVVVEKKIGRTVTDPELASHLMYPKVFADYAAERAAYGDVATLPTAVFFYGMEAGQEINIDLERGKTLIVRYITTSDVHEDGTRTVFFELNGQPRPLRVPDRSQVAKRPPPRKVEPGNLKHVGAPMPGTIGTVAARPGMKVARGDVLLTLEAMKMETTVRCEQDGTVKEVLATPGMAVDAKDLLVIFD
jgi:pyruvate carboxylase